jgi:hypothetical protein
MSKRALDDGFLSLLRRNSVVLMIITVALAVAIGVIVYMLWPNGGPEEYANVTPAPTPIDDTNGPITQGTLYSNEPDFFLKVKRIDQKISNLRVVMHYDGRAAPNPAGGFFCGLIDKLITVSGSTSQVPNRTATARSYQPDKGYMGAHALYNRTNGQQSFETQTTQPNPFDGKTQKFYTDYAMNSNGVNWRVAGDENEISTIRGMTGQQFMDAFQKNSNMVLGATFIEVIVSSPPLFSAPTQLPGDEDGGLNMFQAVGIAFISLFVFFAILYGLFKLTPYFMGEGGAKTGMKFDKFDKLDLAGKKVPTSSVKATPSAFNGQSYDLAPLLSNDQIIADTEASVAEDRQKRFPER